MNLDMLLTLLGGTGLQFENQLVFQLVIPSNAGPNDPRIEIGGTAPADLVARYALLGETIVGGAYFYKGVPGSYGYIILTSVGTTARICFGARDGAGNIAEMFSITMFAASMAVLWGRLTTTLATLLQNTIQNNNFEFQGIASGATFNARLIMSDATAITIQDTASIDVIETGVINLTGTASGHSPTFTADRGATVVVDADGAAIPVGGEVNVDSNTADSATFTTTETEVQTVTGNLEIGRTYEIVAEGSMGTTANDSRGVVRIREDNVSGTQLQERSCDLSATSATTAAGMPYYAVGRYTAGASGNKTFSLTMQRGNGSGTLRQEASATAPATFKIVLVI